MSKDYNYVYGNLKKDAEKLPEALQLPATIPEAKEVQANWLTAFQVLSQFLHSYIDETVESRLC